MPNIRVTLKKSLNSAPSWKLLVKGGNNLLKRLVDQNWESRLFKLSERLSLESWLSSKILIVGDASPFHWFLVFRLLHCLSFFASSHKASSLFLYDQFDVYQTKQSYSLCVLVHLNKRIFMCHSSNWKFGFMNSIACFISLVLMSNTWVSRGAFKNWLYIETLESNTEI